MFQNFSSWEFNNELHNLITTSLNMTYGKGLNNHKI